MERLIPILLGILSAVAGAASPALRDIIKTDVQRWEDAAKKTTSPFDDIVVRVVKTLLNL